MRYFKPTLKQQYHVPCMYHAVTCMFLCVFVQDEAKGMKLQKKYKDKKKMKTARVFASSRQLVNLLLFKIQITKGEQKTFSNQQEKNI